MGTNSSKKRKKTGCGEERLTGVRHGTLERERRERKRSVGKKCAIGWTKSGPVLASEKTVVWERPHKASQTSTPSLSTSLRYSDFSRVVRKFSLEIDDVKPMYIPYEIDEVVSRISNLRRLNVYYNNKEIHSPFFLPTCISFRKLFFKFYLFIYLLFSY